MIILFWPIVVAYDILKSYNTQVYTTPCSKIWTSGLYFQGIV